MRATTSVKWSTGWLILHSRLSGFELSGLYADMWLPQQLTAHWYGSIAAPLFYCRQCSACAFSPVWQCPYGGLPSRNWWAPQYGGLPSMVASPVERMDFFFAFQVFTQVKGTCVWKLFSKESTLGHWVVAKLSSSFNRFCLYYCQTPLHG